MIKRLTLLAALVAATAAQAQNVTLGVQTNSTGTVVKPSNFWPANIAAIAANLTATFQPANSSLTAISNGTTPLQNSTQVNSSITTRLGTFNGSANLTVTSVGNLTTAASGNATGLSKGTINNTLLPTSGIKIWIGAAYRNDPEDNRLWWVYSVDGKTFNVAHGEGWRDPRGPNPPNGTGYLVHDTNWVQEGDVLYVAYNNHAAQVGYNTFSITSTTDFVTHTTPVNVDVSACSGSLGGAVIQVWSPIFFKDTDGSIHIIFSASDIYNHEGMQVFEIHPQTTLADAVKNNTWSTPVRLAGIPEQCFNAAMVRNLTTGEYEVYLNHYYQPVNANYYMEHYRAPTITGNYTADGVNSNWTGNIPSPDWEGPSIVSINSTARRLYIGKPVGEEEMWYSEFTDASGNFFANSTTSTPLSYVKTPFPTDQTGFGTTNDLSTIIRLMAANTSRFDSIVRFDGKVGIGSFRAGDTPTHLLSLDAGRSYTDPKYQAAGGVAGISLSGPNGGGIYNNVYGYWNNIFPLSKVNQYTASVGISGTIIDWFVGNSANTRTKTISANTTFTFANPTEGQITNVVITNTGNFTVSWPTVKWKGGAAPTQTKGNATDIYTFQYIGGQYFGSASQNYQ